jgi:lipopolysaccharide/colanic/teichoic acid biosynthesis glycosyltransferase
LSMLIFPVDASPARLRGERKLSAVEVAKRAIDVSGSLIGLILLAPVFGLIAIAIKLDSRGPVFFVQERVGVNRRRSASGNGNGNGNGHRGGNGNGNGNGSSGERRYANRYGRPIQVIKFRSMVTDAEKATGPVWAAAGDTRVTRVGRILRKTRLDEFPQLMNVLCGEMSLVGPRPERFFFVKQLEDVIPGYAARCEVMPGITGLAQVKRGYDSSVESANAKLQYDLYYVRNRRLLLDLKIMADTVRVMASGDGAH